MMAVPRQYQAEEADVEVAAQLLLTATGMAWGTGLQDAQLPLIGEVLLWRVNAIIWVDQLRRHSCVALCAPSRRDPCCLVQFKF